MESLEGWMLWVALVAVGIAGWICYAHRRWQDSVDRERFVLAMKAASTPERLEPDERDRLRRLRAPWWAVWIWLPEQLGP